jgi:uncharacterized RDD family membrane protein YckC
LRPHEGTIGKMTQQDETGQGEAQRPEPARPSPYLDGGESVPQAYLAPPQLGKPGYGMPSAYRPGLRTGVSQRQPPAQPGQRQPWQRQPGPGQPRYRQPAGRPRSGMQARRDPVIAAPWERLVASVLDWIIIVMASVLAFWTPLMRLFHEFEAIASSMQTSPSPAAEAALTNFATDPSHQHTVLYWYLAMFGIALAYYWVQHAAWGATVGKRALGVRVVQAGDRSRIGVRAAGIRAVAFLVGPALFLLGGPIALAGGVLWVADAGLSLVDPRAQCLHDKLAGTIVVRQRWLNQQARSDQSW